MVTLPIISRHCAVMSLRNQSPIGSAQTASVVGDTKTAFGRPPRAECGGMIQSQAGVTCSDCTDRVSGIR
jgi:hypothetical protein